MNLLAQIDSDCKSLSRYFERLFELLEEAEKEDLTAPFKLLDGEANESFATHHRISHLVKPDMVMNVYSLTEFWMQKICKSHQSRKRLSLSYCDIKGKSDLHAYRKYLTRYLGMDLSDVESSYERLDQLRMIRNCFIHGGGHVPDGQEARFSEIDGIVLSGSLVLVEERFVWDVLDHAKRFISASARL